MGLESLNLWVLAPFSGKMVLELSLLLGDVGKNTH